MSSVWSLVRVGCPEGRERTSPAVVHLRDAGRSLSLGRDAARDVVLDAGADAPIVSRRHARLRMVRMGEGLECWVVEDSGSKNGTFVNWERLPEGRAHGLLHGDVVSFGGNEAADDAWSDSYAYMCLWGYDEAGEERDAERRVVDLGRNGRLVFAERRAAALTLAPLSAEREKERIEYLLRVSRAAARAWTQRELVDDVPRSLLDSLLRPPLILSFPGDDGAEAAVAATDRGVETDNDDAVAVASAAATAAATAGDEALRGAEGVRVMQVPAKLSDALRCPLCRKAMCLSVALRPCGHGACFPCLALLWDGRRKSGGSSTTNCPTCGRAASALVRTRAVDDAAESVMDQVAASPSPSSRAAVAEAQAWQSRLHSEALQQLASVSVQLMRAFSVDFDASEFSPSFAPSLSSSDPSSSSSSAPFCTGIGRTAPAAKGEDDLSPPLLLAAAPVRPPAERGDERRPTLGKGVQDDGNDDDDEDYDRRREKNDDEEDGDVILRSPSRQAAGDKRARPSSSSSSSSVLPSPASAATPSSLPIRSNARGKLRESHAKRARLAEPPPALPSPAPDTAHSPTEWLFSQQF